MQGTPTAGTIVLPARATPDQIYAALRNQRSELRQQLRTIELKRQSISEALPRTLDEVARKGLQERVVELDKQINALDKQIADAEAQVARAAAVPGAVAPPGPPIPRSHPTDEDYFLIGLFGIIVLLPASIAFARRIWRRSAAKTPNWPVGLHERIDRLEQTMEAAALEIERVGEGQRYVTNLLSEQQPRALGAGSAMPLELKDRERERISYSTPV
jgi:hypothetical protein